MKWTGKSRLCQKLCSPSQLMGRDGFPGLVGGVGHVHVEDIVEPEPEAVPGFKRVGYALGRTVPVIVKIVCRVLHLLVDALFFLTVMPGAGRLWPFWP